MTDEKIKTKKHEKKQENMVYNKNKKQKHTEMLELVEKGVKITF